MKFPLPPDTFPSLNLTAADRDDLENLANVFISESLRQYQEHREQHHGVVDGNRWKVVRTKESLTAYEDKSAHDAARKSSTISQGAVGNLEGGRAKQRLQSIFVFGTIPGDLDDLMYGMIHPTTEMLKIKTAYMEDKIVDCDVLAALVNPTPEEPVRGLHLKWSVSEFAPLLLRQIVRPRDFLYLESTGIHVTESGERIGFNLMHSLEVPGIRELHEYKIVRGSLSICGLYRQKRDGIMELFVKGFVDPLGDLNPGIAAVATSEALMSFGMSIHCAQMKKLNWLLSKSSNAGFKQQRRHNARQQQCTVCEKPLRHQSSRKACRVCSGRMCSHCRVAKRLSFLSPLTRKVVSKSMWFCTRCVNAACRTNALLVARDEVATAFGAFEMTSSLNSSPSSARSTLRSMSVDSMM
ncbi:hypothetical protein BBJ28_00000461 [Nothophytophthora sp. Chile5]|nr:hypothetical protein BBJ28_00000461 [Nothophytophthora sp. Chile5]